MGRGPRGVRRRRRQADADVMVMARCVRARYWRRRALVTNSRVALLISNNASTSWQHLAHIVSVRPRFVSFHRPGNHDLRNLTGGENVRRVWRQELVCKPELLLTIKQCLIKTVSSAHKRSCFEIPVDLYRTNEQQIQRLKSFVYTINSLRNLKQYY